MSLFNNPAHERALELEIIAEILPGLRKRLGASTTDAERAYLEYEIEWHMSRRTEILL